MDLKTLQRLQGEVESILEILGLNFIRPEVELGEGDVLRVDLSSVGGTFTESNLDEGGSRLGILIGYRGETLSALEYILSLMVNSGREDWLRVQLDVDGYRERRVSNLVGIAEDAAQRVLTAQEPITLQPMSNVDRRVIHTALSDRPGLMTESIGEGRRRRVVIKPR